MRFLSVQLILGLLLGAFAPLCAQSVVPAPSALLRPGLEAVEAGLESVRTERWKLPQAARDEVQGNLGSIHRDLETTLPPLVATAEGKPASVAAALPVLRNINALYDVLLRIEERAKVAAPADQLAALEQARTALDASRRGLDEALQEMATAQEARPQAPVVAPLPPAPCTPSPTKKKSGPVSGK